MQRTRFSIGLAFTFSILSAFILIFSGCSDSNCPICDNEQPLVQLSAHKVDFGASSTSASFVISNSGKGSLAWDLEVTYRPFLGKAATSEQGDWLTLSANSGDGDATVFLTADRELLESVGVHRAVVYVNTPGAGNQARDSVEVYILAGGMWVETDDGSYETCVSVDNDDYYWAKRFTFPENLGGIFIDSIAMTFCEADTIIQVLAFDEEIRDPGAIRSPGTIWRGTPFYYEVAPGTNVFSFDWYLPFTRFYIGYFQRGASVPRLQIDSDAPAADSTSWRARDFTSNPEDPQLGWQNMAAFETFAIQVFVTPVLPYNPKMVAEYRASERQSEASLRTGFAYKGKYPASLKPPVDE